MSYSEEQTTRVLTLLTPSMEDGLHPDCEQPARAVGCHWILQIANSLDLPPVTITTGCMLLQRFFWTNSLVEHHPHFMAAACLSLACQLEETPRRPNDILVAYLAGCAMHRGEPACSLTGKEMHYYRKALSRQVNTINKSIGYSLVVRSPLSILACYIRAMCLGDASEEAMDRAEVHFRSSLFTDLCVRYEPEEITLACIFLACQEMTIQMPPYPPAIAECDVISIADEITALTEQDDLCEELVLRSLQTCFEYKALRKVSCVQPKHSKCADMQPTETDTQSESDFTEAGGVPQPPIGYKSVAVEASNEHSKMPSHDSDEPSRVPIPRPHPVPGQIVMMKPEEQHQAYMPAQFTPQRPSAGSKRPQEAAFSDSAPASKRPRMSTI